MPINLVYNLLKKVKNYIMRYIFHKIDRKNTEMYKCEYSEIGRIESK